MTLPPLVPETPSAIVDASGYIVHDYIRAHYDALCDSPRGARLHFERVRSAEAYLALALRLEQRHGLSRVNALLGLIDQKTR